MTKREEEFIPTLDRWRVSRLKGVDSWMLPVFLNGVKTHALVDSGASCCLLSKAVYDQMPTNRSRLIGGGKTIRGVGNHTLATIGEIEVDVTVAGKDWPIKMSVSSEKEPVGCYIGMNFFQTHGCEFSVLTGRFTIGNKTVKLVAESHVDVCARIRAQEDVLIPPHTEILVKGKPEALHKRMRTELAIIEPSKMMKTLEGHGVYMGTAVTTTTQDRVPMSLINTSGETQLVRKGTTLAMMHPAVDVEDQDEVIRLNRPEGEKSKNAWTSSQGQELPDHLKPLLEGLAKDVTLEQKQRLIDLIARYKDVFSQGPMDAGRTDLVKHEIDTGERRPIRQPARRLPITKQAVEEKEVLDMLERGVIEPSSSPWASPVVLVTKKDGSARFCIDYRKLNEVTRKDAYPLPRIDETLDALEGSDYFCTLDLYSGYWQVEMDDRDKEKTAFVTRRGLYQFNVMPFGLCNAPATFERLMDLVLRENLR